VGSVYSVLNSAQYCSMHSGQISLLSLEMNA